MIDDKTKAYPRKSLVISTDNLLFSKDSDVRRRQEAYAKDWDEVHIVVFGKKDKKETVIGHNIWIYPTQNRFRIFRPFKALSIARFIAERRNVRNVSCQDPFETGFVGMQLKRKLKDIYLEYQCHTDPGSPYFIKKSILNIFRMILMKINIPYADHMRVVSNKVRQYFVSLGIKEDIIEVRPIKIDEDEIRNAPITINLKDKYPDFRKIILMASRITEEKNISLAISAMKILIDNGNRDIGLIIVGDGRMKEKLITMCHKLNIDKQVIFLPWANKTELYSMYKTADVFLNTSYFEGYGMSMVEAVAANLRVVSTDVGVARDIGATITSFDKGDLSKILSDILK